jgi:hypothetical protein
MSFVQRFFTAIFPRAWAEDMQADSLRWMIHCNKCGYERSVWETGGIRWRAYGSPRWLRRCPHCGQISWHKVYKKTS